MSHFLEVNINTSDVKKCQRRSCALAHKAAISAVSGLELRVHLRTRSALKEEVGSGFPSYPSHRKDA